MAGAIIRHACKPSTPTIPECCKEVKLFERMLGVNAPVSEWPYCTSVTLPFTNVTFKSLYT